jgi:hypothetical protein
MKPTLKAVWRWGPAFAYVAGGFAAATAVALVDERGSQEIVLPTRSAEPARPELPARSQPAAPHVPLTLARAPIAVDPSADLFPPPPAPLRPAASEAPQVTARPRPEAPPFTYSYVGRMEEDGVTRLLLARGEQLLILSRGDKIEGGFRLDRIDADSITVSHPATRTKRTLPLDALAAQRAAPVANAAFYGAPDTPPGYGYVPQPPPVDPPTADTLAPEPVPPAPVLSPPGTPQPQGVSPGAASDASSNIQGSVAVGGVTVGNSGMAMGAGGTTPATMAPQPVVPISSESGTR